MPGYKYKELFNRINESRKSRGISAISWPEFLGKEPKAIYREKIKILDHIDDEQPKKFQRPPAVYDNKSTYDKYGF